MNAGSGSSQVRTVEIIASLVLCLFSIKFALGVIFTEVKGYKVDRTNRNLAALATQMAGVDPISQNRPSRGPASVKLDPKAATLRPEGIIGLDPWGRPYAYKYFRDEQGRTAFLVLLSGGKNVHIETKISGLNLSQITSGSYNFIGDDLGYIKKIDIINK